MEKRYPRLSSEEIEIKEMNEHFWQVWFNSVQWFQRRRFKCEKLTDGSQMDAYP
jgi:hypothetical protein